MFLKSLSLLLVDTAMILLADLAAFYLRFRSFAHLSDLYVIWPFIVLIRLFYLYAKGFYKKGFTSITDIWLRTLSNVTISTAFIVAVTFFNRNLSFSRLVLVYSWAVTFLLISLERTLIFLAASLTSRTRRVAVVGDNISVKRVLSDFAGRKVRAWRLVGVIPVTRMKASVPVLRTLAEFLEQGTRDRGVDLLILSLDGLSELKKLKILSRVRGLGYDYRIIPSFYDLITSRSETEGLSQLSILEPLEHPLKIEDRLVKRIFDIFFSGSALLLLLPVYLAVGIGVALTSGFPVIYRQKRIGRNARPFNIYKFRTMVRNADRIGPALTEHNDHRVVPFGRFLRRTSLDEIPQFFNVFRGDMSVVGPRPEVPEIVKDYTDWQKEVLKVRPGITGLPQISGRQDLAIDVKSKMDLYYIENYSLSLDIRIILRTLLIPFNAKGAR